METQPAAGLDALTFDEVQARLADRDWTLVDVLPRASYESAHIRGAVSLPLESIERDAQRVLPDTAAEIGLYCASPT